MSDLAGADPKSLAGRLWIYQAERFPLARTIPLLLAFSASSVTASAHLAGRPVPEFWAYATAFVVVLVFFWQMRVADEVKDADTDARWRPERPIPRGLVSLRLIVGLGIASSFVALAAAFAFDPWLVLLVLMVWAWLGLMTVEFFAPKLLHASPALYLATHMAIMPLIDVFLTGCEWLPAGHGLPTGLWTFLLMSLANGCVAEFSRKIWAPVNERPGVDTYTSAWGISAAVAALAGAWLLGFFALIAYGHVLAMTKWFVIAGAAASLPIAGSMITLLASPTPAAQKRLETLSGIWILLCYVLAATLPFVIRI
ncbi:MAG: UbiA family prenyltransferase [Rhodoplanes sp.]|uniref:UbiA family prenyltransferase n=1 Tax=Rhodoplanes sp. TaxID=1968906 RepID=UPI0017CFCC06|nr:UbiA family prenyltransferase [Rhodoplanes sp.]NVO12414.1 UbiA family prenyltransferase [Rhodoplanes sp.]